jgi:hypothetical protein
MSEATTITPELKNSLDALENAHNITRIGAWLEDTTHREFGEYVIITSDLYNWAGAKYLYKNAKVYCDIAAEVIKSHLIQDKGTEEDWPVTSEFEGMADDACVGFCNSHGLLPDLRKCLSEANNIFLDLQNLTAEYDCFPADEYEEDGHIVIEVEVSSDQDTAFREYDAYTDWLIDNISDDNLKYFVVTVRRTE